MNPIKLYFGDDAESHLETALKPFGKNVMLTYGGGSSKKNGIYDTAMKSLAATIINPGGYRQLIRPEVVEIFQASL